MGFVECLVGKWGFGLDGFGDGVGAQGSDAGCFFERGHGC